MENKTLQFKRNLTFNGGLQDAINNITNNLNPKLQVGEPLLCSYNDNGSTKLILAFGVEDGNIRIIPAFNDYNEILSFIKNNNAEMNLKDQISEESDFSISTGNDDKLIFKIKDNLKNNWIDLNNE